jgi:hypothetical protein
MGAAGGVAAAAEDDGICIDEPAQDARWERVWPVTAAAALLPVTF